MKTHSHARHLALGLTLTLLFAACGGSETTETTTTTAAAPDPTAASSTTTAEPPQPTTTAAKGKTFVGADGVETTITDVSRIVSLNGDLTEILFELGFGDNVVAVDVTTTYPPEASAMNDQGQTVGFAQQLTAEAVLSFEPTLVLGDTQVAPPEALEQLRASGIPVVILDTATKLEDVGTKIRQVAEVVGADEEGELLADRVLGEIDEAVALAEQAEGDPRIAYVYLRGPQVIFLFGAGMPTQAMIEGAGAVDAGVVSGVFGPAPLTPEALIAAAPEVIVLPEAGLGAMGGIDAFLEIPGVADTPAAQGQNFLIYDEAYFFNLGPRAGRALNEFVHDLYPNLDQAG